MTWWEFENLPAREPAWHSQDQIISEWDELDWHIDLGCGTLPKGRIGIDRHGDVDILMDFDNLRAGYMINDRDRYERHEMWRPQTKSEDFHSRHYWSQGWLPFPDNSIGNIIAYHSMEHVGLGFIHLMDEIWRVMQPGSVFRLISPLFPSNAAICDPDHKRYFCENTFETFCGAQNGEHWMESFSVPYTRCRFEMVDKWFTPAPLAEDTHRLWDVSSVYGSREIRVALRKWD